MRSRYGGSQPSSTSNGRKTVPGRVQVDGANLQPTGTTAYAEAMNIENVIASTIATEPDESEISDLLVNAARTPHTKRPAKLGRFSRVKDSKQDNLTDRQVIKLINREG